MERKETLMMIKYLIFFLSFYFALSIFDFFTMKGCDATCDPIFIRTHEKKGKKKKQTEPILHLEAHM